MQICFKPCGKWQGLWKSQTDLVMILTVLSVVHTQNKIGLPGRNFLTFISSSKHERVPQKVHETQNWNTSLLQTAVALCFKLQPAVLASHLCNSWSPSHFSSEAAPYWWTWESSSKQPRVPGLCCTGETQKMHLTPGLDLAWPPLLQPLRQWTNGWKARMLSLSLTL